MNTGSLNALTDSAALQALGARLAAVRLKRNLTQTALAREAGVSRATIERLERGAGADLKLLVRVLRALQLLDGFLAGIPSDEPSPMELLRSRGKGLDLILLDLSMPGMGGMASLRGIRAADPDIPVVLTSGFAEEEAVGQVGGLSLAGFLQKPYRARTLIDLVESLPGRNGLR